MYYMYLKLNFWTFWSVIKRVLESKQVVLGVVVVESVSILLSIPKALSVNAAQDAIELFVKLRAYHNVSQIQKDKEQLKWFILDTRSKS